MKTMKKLFALLLALAMIFCLAACDGGSGGKDDDEKKSGKSNSNTFETPLELDYELKNLKKVPSSDDELIESQLTIFNGLAEDLLEDYVSLFKKSEACEDTLSYKREYLENQISQYEDLYGEDFELTYEIIEKTELDSDALDQIRQNLNSMSTSMNNQCEDTNEWDDEQWEVMAERSGLSVKDMKALVELTAEFAEYIEKIEIEEGYTITYKEVNKQKTQDATEGTAAPADEYIEGTVAATEEHIEAYFPTSTITVYKANGRWVSEEALIRLRAPL